MLDSEVSAGCFVGSEDVIAKQVGSEVCCARSEDRIAKQVGSEAEQLGSEGKHEVVESVDDMAKQLGSRWKRAANGQGKVQVKRDRDSSPGRGACRKSIGIHGQVYETDEDDGKDQDQPSNPKRSLDMNVSVIDSVASGGQAHDDANSTATNNDDDLHTPDNPVSILHKMFDIQPHPNRRPRGEMTPPRVPPGLNPLSPVASKRGEADPPTNPEVRFPDCKNHRHHR